MELTRERLFIVTAGAAAVVALGLYFILYQPLINKLRAAGIECDRIENELLQARKAIGYFKAVGKKKILITQGGIPLAIDELTSQGKLNGINFVSMTPGQIEEQKTPCRILPIEMEIESAYKDLGIFLGLLDDLEKSLITVKSFSIKPDGKATIKRKTKLAVNVYLLGE